MLGDALADGAEQQAGEPTAASRPDHHDRGVTTLVVDHIDRVPLDDHDLDPCAFLGVEHVAQHLLGELFCTSSSTIPPFGDLGGVGVDPGDRELVGVHDAQAASCRSSLLRRPRERHPRAP